MKTLILGIGNTIKGDDGVGIYIAKALKEEISFPDIDVKEIDEAGVNLLDIITGYDRLLVVDSITTKDGNPGEIHRLNGLQTGTKPYSSHQIGLPALLKLGKRLGLNLPEEIILYAIDIKESDSFSDILSYEIKKSITLAVDLIKKEVMRMRGDDDGSRSFGCPRNEVPSTSS